MILLKVMIVVAFILSLQIIKLLVIIYYALNMTLIGRMMTQLWSTGHF